MEKLLKTSLIILLIILTFLIFNEPGPIWLFPVFLTLYQFKNFFMNITTRLISKLYLRYVLIGALFGLLIEFLAILNSLSLSPEQRVLFSPEPIPDLILALGYYSLLMTGSYFILKKYNFSLKEFFILGGIFGIIVEEHGMILLQLFNGNILGGIYVFLSYSSFLAIPYMLFQKDFTKFTRKSKFMKYPISMLIMALSYLLFLLYYLLINFIVIRGI